MSKRKNSSPDIWQSKITALWKPATENLNVNNRKRKNETEIDKVQTFKKHASDSNSHFHLEFGEIFSSDEKKNNCEKNTEKDEHFRNVSFEDFENEPFHIPKKENSPRKNILTEKFLNSASENETWQKQKSELSFETPLKCKVLKFASLTTQRFEQIILVEGEKCRKTGICKLRDVWSSTAFSLNDVVSIQAVLLGNDWVVDNQNGFIVLYPDIILSSTSLVSSMFCLRQGILSNLYKGMDSKNSDAMLIGRLVHEFLEQCLKVEIQTDEDFTTIIDKLLQSRDCLHDLYFSNLKKSDLLRTLESFIPCIKNFLDTYVNQKFIPSGRNFKGHIDKILDIEELIKSPTLGLQGRIDVTVKVRSKNTEKTAPLELKTGKASFSAEHRSQLASYILLMKELGRNAESGLLLYLKENIMEEIIPQRAEIRDLFLLRNHFVKFYKNMSDFQLPEPIRNAKSCCKCPYLRVCTSYFNSCEAEKFSENHPLRSIDILDLKDSHVDFFIRWNKMLWLEYGDGVFGENVGEIEISDLTLAPRVEIVQKEFRYHFRRAFRGKSIQPGTLVQIMSGKGNRICRGRVFNVTDSEICVSLTEKLETTLDGYKIFADQSKFLNLYLTNLGWFLEKKFEFLRDIIIERQKPTFQEKFNKKNFEEKCLKYLMDLNKTQQQAVLKSLLCNNYFLIKGPPGTGKTQTIAALVKILVSLGNSVLISGHTHSSVDNILLKLGDIEFLRLGSLQSVRKEIRSKSYASLIENCFNFDDINKLFERKVVASTCSGLDSDFIKKKTFDVCIIDESSQVLQVEVLRPLLCCKKFILVGDEDQLPPIIQNPEAKKLGMNKSIFEWLINDSATVCLKLQYRMNSAINSLANSICYNGLIECANNEVAHATLNVSNGSNYLSLDEWIREVLSDDLEKSVVFIDTSNYFKGGGENSSRKSRSSVLEANIVKKLVLCLISLGIEEQDIGIISSFCEQIRLLQQKLAIEKLSKIELNTVDQYQGRDKKVILFSCAKENQQDTEVSESELLSDKRRLTVAVTRSKHKFILVGDKQTVNKYRPFQQFINNLHDYQFIRLSNGEKNFFWHNFID